MNELMSVQPWNGDWRNGAAIGLVLFEQRSWTGAWYENELPVMPVSKDASLFVPDGIAELTVLSAEVDPGITPGTPETAVGVEIAPGTVGWVGCATGVGEIPFSVDGVGCIPTVGTGVASTDPPELPSWVTGIGELSGTGVAVGMRMTVGVATATGDVIGVGVGPVV